MDRVITSFYRVKCVLTLIIDGEGANDYVESKRGVKHENLRFDYNLNTEYLLRNNGSTEFMFEDEDDENLPFDEV